MCVYDYMCLNGCLCIDVCAWMCAWMCPHVCVHMYICKSISFVCLHGCVLASMCCMGICMDVYISVSACMCEYPCTFSINIMPFAGCMSLSGDSWLSAFDYTQTIPNPSEIILINLEATTLRHEAVKCECLQMSVQGSRRTDQGLVTEKCMPVHPSARALEQP